MGSVFGNSNVLADFELRNPVIVAPAPKKMRDPRVKARPIPHEENMQIRCATYLKRDYPDILFSSDAAGWLKLTPEQGARLKKQNGSRGRPDMSIDCPSRGYHGLRLELKKEGAKVYKKDGVTLRKQVARKKTWIHGKLHIVEYDHLQEQAKMIAEYNRLGYYADFVIGYDAFVKIVDWYLDRKTSLDISTEF